MKFIKIAAGLLFLTIMLNSCLLTFYPIYTKEDVIYDEGITGNYTLQGEDQRKQMQIIRLSAAGINVPPGIRSIQDKGYLVRYLDEEKQPESEYIVFMVELDNNRYMDFYPYRKDPNEFGAYSSLKVAMHAIYKVNTGSGKKLVLQRFDQEFLQEMISKKQIRLKHERIDDKYVITASTKELQQYITKYGNNAKAYEEDPAVYNKK